MIQGINDTRITAGSDRSQALLRVATQRDLEYSTSSITREGGGVAKTVTGSITNLINTVWGGFKWLLSKVFFCYDCSGILGKSRVEVLNDLKQAAVDGKAKLTELQGKYGLGSDARASLSNAWKVVFDGFPQQLQEHLMETYFRGLAVTKNLTDEASIQEFADGYLKDESKRALALRYVRLLQFDKSDDPVEEMTGVSFDFITERLTKEIAKLETK